MDVGRLHSPAMRPGLSPLNCDDGSVFLHFAWHRVANSVIENLRLYDGRIRRDELDGGSLYASAAMLYDQQRRVCAVFALLRSPRNSVFLLLRSPQKSGRCVLERSTLRTVQHIAFRSTSTGQRTSSEDRHLFACLVLCSLDGGIVHSRSKAMRNL